MKKISLLFICFTLVLVGSLSLTSCDKDIDDKNAYISGQHDPEIIGRWMPYLEGGPTVPSDQTLTYVYTAEGRIYKRVGDRIIEDGREVYYRTKDNVLYTLDISSTSKQGKQTQTEYDYRISGDLLSLPGQRFRRVR
ncbi:hypothetical protein HQ45_04470 [Porphyromonas crevioricanis]|uniref:Lipocalin-like domain-containing protein n=2 Tax=Porphyromonas crevioricanis TaxID=393921 RepID=A0A0A2FJ43_9PORP|nr:hypothetical protein [Porphyromonas crevioricanis]KGN90075.1 hypothetical protein HQ45_04470 [Porphyromonas crevioricanis]KGN94256.1 hypothetical protein HQ38_06965 [Porphyromonas crevioricanis]SJZ69795.1 hypothetical protein SAMN02745203_00618 [Porphyromonas crevioricanis]SQH72284.1 Uncharacterised protein [Porphyromonas crevioricanis]GAD05115.1 hypothetical protein PORCRE_813 [Porphyromonas crevioricanis JCM 15906]